MLENNNNNTESEQQSQSVQNNTDVTEKVTTEKPYRVFNTKKEFQEMFDTKLKHILTEKSTLEIQLKNLETVDKDKTAKLVEAQKKLLNLANAEWKSLGGKKEFDKLTDWMDFNNLKKSMLKYADENQISLPKTANSSSAINNVNSHQFHIGKNQGIF